MGTIKDKFFIFNPFLMGGGTAPPYCGLNGTSLSVLRPSERFVRIGWIKRLFRIAGGGCGAAIWSGGRPPSRR